MFSMVTYIFACCVLFAVVRSAPIGRYDKMLSEETDCEPNENTYSDPVDVLGPDFPRQKMATMCESDLLIESGSVIAKKKFTRRGCRTCSSVCARYQQTVYKDRCTASASLETVTVLDAYCEPIVGGDRPAAEQGQVHSSCACLYKVQRDGSTDVLHYTFDVNATGALRVTVVESGHHRPDDCPSDNAHRFQAIGG